MQSTINENTEGAALASTGIILNKKGDTLRLSSLIRPDGADGFKPTKIYLRTASRRVATFKDGNLSKLDLPLDNTYKIENDGTFYDSGMAALVCTPYIPSRIPGEVMENGIIEVGKRFTFMSDGQKVTTGRITEIIALSDNISREGEQRAVVTMAPTEFLWFMTWGLIRAK